MSKAKKPVRKNKQKASARKSKKPAAKSVVKSAVKSVEAEEADEDAVHASQAPLSEHLAELRRRLAISLAGFAAAFVLAFIFAGEIFDFLLLPYERASGSGRAIRLIYTAPHEFFLTQIKLSFFGAFMISFPLIAQQLYRFVVPGLYRHERRAFLPFLLAAPLLFLSGAALVYYVIMPLALGFFLAMEVSGEVAGGGGGGADMLRIEMLPRVSEYLSLAMALMMAFGLCFQLPVLIALLARAGLVTAKGLAGARKYAIVGIFALAAILTPPDIISQVGLALPVLLLYEASIIAARRMAKKAKEKK